MTTDGRLRVGLQRTALGAVVALLGLGSRLPALQAADGPVASPAPADVDLAFAGESLDEWHGFRRHRFRFDGADAWVVEPARPLPGAPFSWCLAFPDAFTQRCAAPALLDRGLHHVFLDVGNTFGAPAAIARLERFHDMLVDRGFASRAVLVGISRGGLTAHRYATEHPARVAVIYGDAPVLDFRSWPGGRGRGTGSPRDWEALKGLYGFPDDAAAIAYAGQPIDTLGPLARHGVGLVYVVGDADEVVPWEENTAVAAERYRALGGDVAVIHKPGVGHHPHGLDDPAPVVEAILGHLRRPAR